MIDSLRAAAVCAEEALRDPGGLRYAHVPSLVAFVTDLDGATDTKVDWDPPELAAGVRLNRLLWELGLRDEATRLFGVLATRLRRMPRTSAEAVELGNALASVGLELGRQKDVRAILTPLAEGTGAGVPRDDARTDTPTAERAEARGVLDLITWTNLAAVELSLGDIDTAAVRARLVRIWMHTTGSPYDPELSESLAAVELRLAAAGALWQRPGEDSPETELARHAAAFVREVAGDGPRALFSVAGLAMARLGEALNMGSAQAVTTAVQVLEIACQRLSVILGTDHPQVLGVLADLAAGQAELARITRSPALLERAIEQLTSVYGRMESRLGPGHPRAVAALANLVTARVESVRASTEPRKADWTAEALAKQAWHTGRLLGEGHPVTRLVRASAVACRRMAARDGDAWGGGSLKLMTLTDEPKGWETDSGAYRSYADLMGGLGRDEGPVISPRRVAPVAPRRSGTYREVALQAFGHRPPTTGDVVLGIVVHVLRDRLVLVLAGAVLGAVPDDELSVGRTVPPETAAAVGDVMEALVLGREDVRGRQVLSVRRARSRRAWSDLEQIKAEGGIVAGRVIGIVEDGLVLDTGVRAFLPTGFVDMGRDIHPRRYMGMVLEAKIIGLDRDEDRVLLSRRAWLEEQRFEDRGRRAGAPRRGEVRPGVVTGVVDYGAFVDVGGVVGLVHRSELSWQYIDHPSEVVTAGQEVTVEVLDVGFDADKDRDRVALSLKSVRDDPWQRFVLAHRQGEIVEARVTERVTFGVFVRVEEGLDGLVHRSEMGTEEAVAVGDDLFVEIVEIDFARRRVLFSLERADWSPGRYPTGAPYVPARYGMASSCDVRGHLLYPDGFDTVTEQWLPGYEEQRERWEHRCAAAEERFRRHRAWALGRRGR